MVNDVPLGKALGRVEEVASVRQGVERERVEAVPVSVHMVDARRRDTGGRQRGKGREVRRHKHARPRQHVHLQHGCLHVLAADAAGVPPEKHKTDA